ncbi:S1C family serine protease [Steroidobacter flavus]|uniref:S1C family serine protease n=1 Tax=Steroidobacter flavus TaxID=1842136 RepID=A0ABV8T2Z9_9GAMM
MNLESNPLQLHSQAIEAIVAAAKTRIVAIRNAAHRHVTGFVWHPDAIVASEQTIGERDEYEIVATNGHSYRAQIVGRDAGTNVLVLRPSERIDVSPYSPALPTLGGLALALAANVDGTPAVRIGGVRSVGDGWFSRAGGRIDQRITLDIRLHRTEEGGPVVDAMGALIGMSTLGRPGEVLAIPTATLDRVVPQLIANGRVARGWLGVALQPIAVPDALVEQAGQRIAMMVMSLAEQGPAATAGVTVGDILLTVDGIALRGMRPLAARLSEENIGQSVEVRLIRGGHILKLDAQIGTRP